jgi:hypothetical protein
MGFHFKMRGGSARLGCCRVYNNISNNPIDNIKQVAQAGADQPFRLSASTGTSALRIFNAKERIKK